MRQRSRPYLFSNTVAPAIVGATRQWVTQSLDKLKSAGVLEITRNEIIIHNLESLEE